MIVLTDTDRLDLLFALDAAYRTISGTVRVTPPRSPLRPPAPATCTVRELLSKARAILITAQEID